MFHTSETSSSLQDRIAEIQNEAKKNKVQLTPEVHEYIREHLEAVQQKLAKNEQVYEEDLAFIKDVRLWVSLPEQLRKIYKNIEKMKQSANIKDIVQKASDRGISIKQLFDLRHIASAKKRWQEWIDETFTFPGGFRIETVGQLNLSVCASLTTLPDNLTVNTNLNLSDCISLTSLPSNLTVGGFLSLKNCTSLTDLPDDLNVRGDLDLTKNLKEQVIQDAKRLKKEGKIKGQIKFRN